MITPEQKARRQSLAREMRDFEKSTNAVPVVGWSPLCDEVDYEIRKAAEQLMTQSKPMYPEKYEELLTAAEEYAKALSHEYMNPEMDRFLAVVRKARVELLSNTKKEEVYAEGQNEQPGQ